MVGVDCLNAIAAVNCYFSLITNLSVLFFKYFLDFMSKLTITCVTVLTEMAESNLSYLLVNCRTSQCL